MPPAERLPGTPMLRERDWFGHRSYILELTPPKRLDPETAPNLRVTGVGAAHVKTLDMNA